MVLLLRWKWYLGVSEELGLGLSPPGLCRIQKNTWGWYQQPFKAEDSPDILDQSPSKGLSSLQTNVPFEMPMFDPRHN